ncbi:MAG: helix-turn-helix transcriptional regulator [Ruminococcaceae bacterium]|nr:helix-turn-helix transcriptional regulator [Oscillospiraceae bacterium]
MEKKTMGSFMSALRKANGLTQQQVADKLNVSNKTVSKWECDEGYPEITMLPAIAEIYSVTVDELLRGERISKDNCDCQKNDVKTEKQMKYLFLSSEKNYSTLSIVSLVLSFFALFISLFFSASSLGIIIAVLLVGAAVIMEVIAFMNYKVIFEEPEISVSDERILQSKIKTRKIIVSIFAVSAVTLAEIIINLTYGFFLPWLALAVFAVMIACVFLYKFIGRKLSIEEKLTEEYISYRQKLVRKISILSAITFGLCIVLPFASVFVEDSFEESAFSFQADTQLYDSESSAKTDYYKLKNHIQNGSKIYYCSGFGETELDIYSFEVKTSETQNGLIITEIYELEWEYKEFSSKRERDEFAEKYVVDRNVYDNLYWAYESSQSITFDDESFMINMRNTAISWNSAFDIMPAFLLAGAVISMVIIAVGFVKCRRKKIKSN